MHKAENSLSGLIHLSDDSSEEEISVMKEQLQDAGFSRSDSDWLVDVFKRPDCFGDPNGNAVFREDFTAHFEEFFPTIVETLTEKGVHIEKDRQTSLALLLSCMLELGIVGNYPRWFLPNAKRKDSSDSTDETQWMSEFRRYSKFCAEDLDWHKLIAIDDPPQFDDPLPFLFPDGVSLDKIVDVDLLDPVQRRSWSSNDIKDIDPNRLEFWLIWRFKADAKRRNIINLGTLLPVFAELPEDVLGEKILGLHNAIYDAMNYASSPSMQERLDALNDGWKVVADELISFLELLNAKKPESTQERSSLVKAWWRLSKVIYSWSMGGLETKLSDELRTRLVESASRHIGILRSVLRDTPEVFEDEDAYDFYEKAFYVLLSFAPPWKRLRPLLLVFTEMKAQAVASHLGFWNESGRESPPHPFSQIPLWVGMSMYPQHLRAELEKDPHLQDLREEFAKFCLERLKTRVKNRASDYTNADFVEPRPTWRGCYVQALTALRVNPGGRAHRTLFWLLNNDPDKTVRELAKKAHRRVRHLDRSKSNLDKGASPRRPLFEAFWWLRQAHLLTLDVEIDSAGAMRTRRIELHRTREKDDRYNWKK